MSYVTGGIDMKLLGRLRMSILTAGEQNPDAWWNSTGLSAAGVADLSNIYPRTAVNAAASHAAELARTHHDDVTRATGVFHLFRLPTEIAAGVHRASIELEQDGHFGDDPVTVMWSELSEIGKSPVEMREGSIDLGSLNLTQREDLARLAHTYKAAFDAGKSCVPYFKLNR